MPISLLQLLARPDLTVDEIAMALDLELPDLCAKHAEPGTQKDIHELESFAATRARIAAIALLPRAVDALAGMIQDYTETARRVPVRDSAERALLTEQQRQNARRACALLLKIANFHPTPRSTHTPQKPHTPKSAPAQQGDAPPAQRIDTLRSELAAASTQTQNQTPSPKHATPQKGHFIPGPLNRSTRAVAQSESQTPTLTASFSPSG
jgi:hypothetical protein